MSCQWVQRSQGLLVYPKFPRHLRRQALHQIPDRVIGLQHPADFHVLDTGFFGLLDRLREQHADRERTDARAAPFAGNPIIGTRERFVPAT